MALRSYSSELSAEMDGEKATVAGWVHEIRDLGGIYFILVRDRDGIIQATLPKSKANILPKHRISKESVVLISGNLKKDERAPNGFEIVPTEIKVLSESNSPLPLDVTGKVDAELDTRLDARFMDLRKPNVQKIFRMKDEVLYAARDFLRKEGFIEVNTPKIVSQGAEGGAMLFPISYFDKEAFLNQSPQLYKQILMAAGFDRVYEIGPIFRAEEHDTTRHLNEATSVDIEASFFGCEDVMKILEKLIVHIHSHISRFVDVDIPKIPFERIRYDEALEMVSDVEPRIEWGDDLTTAHETALGKIIGEHYFVVDWPKETKPFYIEPYDSKICKAFDLMDTRIELASGGQRVSSYEILRDRIEDLNLEGLESYLNAFQYGMPPHAGWGLGAERLLMSILDLKNIREAVLFPRDRKRLAP